MSSKYVPLIALVITAALATSPAIAQADAGAAATKSCKAVNVEFKPDGGGGAQKLKAKNINCTEARRIARECIKGTVRSGWYSRLKGSRFVITKGDMRVSYLPVGGGGCGDLM